MRNELFLIGHAKVTRRKLKVRERPDDRERKEAAMDAVTVDENGQTLGVKPQFMDQTTQDLKYRFAKLAPATYAAHHE